MFPRAPAPSSGATLSDPPLVTEEAKSRRLHLTRALERWDQIAMYAIAESKSMTRVKLDIQSELARNQMEAVLKL